MIEEVAVALKEYRKKRDFTKTHEPSGQETEGHASSHRFVIQKHDASRLHYDFRLEMGRTLKSWALPRGMPYEKGEKRLAVHVEDHPVAYRDFEGVIPAGEYGGGTVMVWDTGSYKALSKSPTKDLAGGKLHFVLKGKKLHGEWYLVRLRDGDQWLMIKGEENLKPISSRAEDTSALSGRSMKQLSRGDKVWHSHRTDEKEKPRTAQIRRHVRKAEAIPAFIEPMQAKLLTAPPRDKGWIYEIKFDGFRAVALKGGDSVELLSRNKKDLGEKFPELVDALRSVSARNAIIDGEIVALDAKGRSSFQLLQAYELGQERPPLFFYAFDLLRLDGHDLTHLPLIERKQHLQTLLTSKVEGIRYSGSVGEDAAALLPQVRQLGLEGLIGKRRDSLYESGRRSGSWIKLKLHHEQEFVIGGYSNPGGSRRYFGALLVGVYRQKKLVFVGKVGTGFNHALLRSLHARMGGLSQEKCPFANLPEKNPSRYGQAITASEMRNCHWVKPQLVCQLKFAEWTRDEKLRQPVFLGLREDKGASEVVREKGTSHA